MYTVNQCVPTKIIKVRENDAPWMNQDIRSLAAKKLRIHTFAKHLDSVWCWALFRRIRNKLTTSIRNRKQEYLLELENRVNDGNNFGNKEWWKLVKQFSAKKGNSNSEIPPLQHENKVYYLPEEKAKILNEHFIKQSTIRGQDDDVPAIPINESIIRPISCLLYTSPSPRDRLLSRMPSSA